MKPTPAQIEAAAKAISLHTGIGLQYVTELAKAALTAAAEVGEQTLPEAIAYANGVRVAMAATIERCAQVAENWRREWKTRPISPELIATAIRTLKDEA